jgi:hypothetical protein
MLLASIDATKHPTIWNIAFPLEILCLFTFFYSGYKLGRFRCPRCNNYVSFGRTVFPSKSGCCRYCGFRLYGEA